VSPAPPWLAPLRTAPSTPHALRLARTHTILASRIETAVDSATRRRGLLGRDGLPPGHTLLIAPCSAIHTWFMRFAIDVLFVDRQGRVVRVRTDVVPFRIAIAPAAYAVFEFASGSLERAGLTRGDALEITPIGT
jgi:uncharacterized membrane protein (UPF0127 family)